MPTHQALRVLLYVMSGFAGIGGIVLIVATSPIIGLTPALVGFPYGAFAGAILKALGIIALGLSYLLYVTARDPVRYVAVIDMMAFILVGAAMLNVYAVIVLHLGALYPSAYFITRAAVQLALAAALVSLRPKSATGESEL